MSSSFSLKVFCFTYFLISLFEFDRCTSTTIDYFHIVAYGEGNKPLLKTYFFVSRLSSIKMDPPLHLPPMGI